MNKILTPLEQKVMNILWQLKTAFVKDIRNNWPDGSKPAYNTISTTVRILQDKGFVSHKAFGRTHQYFPVISQLDYQKHLIGNVINSAFSGSVSSLMSALVDNENISHEELDEIQDMINKSKS